ncbi:MAG TPA: hypothetical protein VKA43_16855 [Gammaproteobacteria bacterium]|nr:hypothetical protein [Gammaproteobacteria bacterium]
MQHALGSRSLLAMGAVLLACAAPASGQWRNAPEANAPRTASGDVDLEAPAPRHASGRVDLQGVWMPDDNRYIRDLALDVGDDGVPYQPWARKLFDERKDGAHSREDPDAHCLPQGVPKLGYVSYPWKLIETPSSVVILYETFTFWRQIFTDGREVDAAAKPAWMGYSTGRWEGDTLVVETTGFNGKAWLDQLGRPTTDRLRVVERFTRTHYGHLRIDVTIDDPGAYTAPWSASQVVHLRPGWEPLEFICGENNKDVENLPGEGGAIVTNLEAARRKGYLE